MLHNELRGVGVKKKAYKRKKQTEALYFGALFNEGI